MFRKFFFGLVAALLFSTAAHAVIPASQGYKYIIGPEEGSSLAAVAAAFAGPRELTWTGCGEWFNNHTICTFASASGPVNMDTTRQDQGLTCPANSTLGGSNCTCNTGYEESGNQCVPANPVCQIGKGHTFNMTVGWARSPNADANDLVGSPAPNPGPYDYNDGACVGNISALNSCWRSQEPSAQGLYRLSCDYTMVVTGSSQTPGDAASNPSTPDATCPGFVGEVNGKTVCVGTASSPLPADSPAPNKPTGAGNPSAGAKPANGEGSGSNGAGRTPTAGSGGNAGGPASAAVGRGGTGDRGEDGEDGTAVCGAAPLPACAVKVDETGVPGESSADGRFQQGREGLLQVESDAQARINDAKEALLPAWTWTFALPTGCAPYPLEAFGLTLDICQFQPMIHDIMSFLWLSATIFGLIALFRQNVGA